MFYECQNMIFLRYVSFDDDDHIVQKINTFRQVKNFFQV